MNTIPQKKIKGIHLSYWPTWLDFWRGNQSELLKQFFNQENIELYYGGKTKQVLVSNYKEELKRAQRFSPSYMVFHVSHIQMEHVYSWNFTYSDWEVLEASAQLINQAFGSTDLGIDLLFENLWWPGLNFLDPELTAKFFQLIEYPRKGFMLDIGHLMLTRPQLKSEEEACHYILEKVEKLGELQHYIKGVHLNKSLVSQYFYQDHSQKEQKLRESSDLWECYMEAGKHIMQLDRHVPFDHPSIQKVIDFIQPEYLVFEFLPESLEQLESMLVVQKKALGW